MRDIGTKAWVARIFAVIGAFALLASCRQLEAPGATPSVVPTQAMSPAGDAEVEFAAGGPSGLVWDPGAEAPVPNIRLRLVRVDTGEVLDETRSGGDGLYRLKAPDPADVTDGTELGIEILLPPGHAFAFGYATPTPFPAGTGGSFEHHVLLVGP